MKTMGTWINIRCPLCNWLHSSKKWQKTDPTEIPGNFGLEFNSQGYRNISNEPLGIFDDIQLESTYKMRIAPRTLFLCGLFNKMGLLSDIRIKGFFKRLFNEELIGARITFKKRLPLVFPLGLKGLRNVEYGEFEI